MDYQAAASMHPLGPTEKNANFANKGPISMFTLQYVSPRIFQTDLGSLDPSLQKTWWNRHLMFLNIRWPPREGPSSLIQEKWSLLSRVWLFVIPLTVANQAPLSMAFVEWAALSFSGELPDLNILRRSPTWQTDTFPSEPPGMFT